MLGVGFSGNARARRKSLGPQGAGNSRCFGPMLVGEFRFVFGGERLVLLVEESGMKHAPVRANQRLRAADHVADHQVLLDVRVLDQLVGLSVAGGRVVFPASVSVSVRSTNRLAAVSPSVRITICWLVRAVSCSLAESSKVIWSVSP